MREIKFRGKRTDNGEWVEGYYCKSYGRHNGYIYDYHSIYDYELGEHYEVIPETVGEYTGLTDKNGKKIFEGDIIKVYERIFEGDIIKVDERIFDVVWDKKKSLFYLENQIVREFADFYYFGYDLEIIGNIHDNSEL